MLRPTSANAGTGRCCGPAVMYCNLPSHLRTAEPSLYFHFALGIRTVPLTCAHVRLLGPCFKTGRVDYRPLATDPGRRSPAPYRLQRQVAEHRQAVHSIQNAAVARAMSQPPEAASRRVPNYSPRPTDGRYATQPITPLRHPRVTRGDTLPDAFSPSVSRSWRSPTGKAHPPDDVRQTSPRYR